MRINKHTRFSATSKMSILVCVIAIVGMATYNWIVSPQKSLLHAAQLYTKSVLDSQNKMSMIRRRTQNQAMQITSLQDQVDKLRTMLFSENGSSEFFADIEQAAQQNGCTLSTLSFMPNEIIGERTDESGTSSIIAKRAFTITTGSYPGILDFLNTLADRNQLVALDDLNIRLRPEAMGYVDCEMTIRIHVAKESERSTDDK